MPVGEHAYLRSYDPTVLKVDGAKTPACPGAGRWMSMTCSFACADFGLATLGWVAWSSLGFFELLGLLGATWVLELLGVYLGLVGLVGVRRDRMG